MERLRAGRSQLVCVRPVDRWAGWRGRIRQRGGVGDAVERLVWKDDGIVSVWRAVLWVRMQASSLWSPEV